MFSSYFIFYSPLVRLFTILISAPPMKIPLPLNFQVTAIYNVWR